ncbi:MAG: ATP-dependent 6-phosphofructokinase [Candidatus Competibacterales bacterium]
MSSIRSIGVLTSGGDCAGLNAVIRAVTARAIRRYGWRVTGVIDGTLGLSERPLRHVPLTLDTFNGDVLRMGGTMLGTVNKGDPFHSPLPDGGVQDRSLDFIAGARELGLDALVAIGGDGSMNIVSRLCARGNVPMVGIPKTIDNDVACTEHAVGFSTAVAVCVEALDRLHSTAASHRRAMILEVMGRDAGHIALESAIAGGADVCLVPEIPYTLQGVIRRLWTIHDERRRHALVVVAEGVATPDGQSIRQLQSQGESRYGGIGAWLAKALEDHLGSMEIRVTVLGHVQRGGTPTWRDRVIASAYGVKAVDLLAAGQFDHMVAWRDRGVVAVPLQEVVARGTRTLDPQGTLVGTARGLGIYLGEE